MAWEITGYPTHANAPIQKSALLTASTPAQQAGQAAWIVATSTAQVTVTLPDASTLVVPLSVGLTIIPCAVTNYVLNSGTATVTNVWTT